MSKYILYVLIIFILLISCQNRISEDKLLEQYNKYKSTVSTIMTKEREVFLENTKSKNIIYVFRKRLDNYTTLDKIKFNYIMSNIDYEKSRTLIRNAYSLDEDTDSYQIVERNYQKLEYIYNILTLINEREKGDEIISKISSKEENFLNHPYTFYETIYLNHLYKFFDFYEKNSISIDDKVTLIGGKLYEHSNPFKLFSKESDVLIVKAITYITENNEQYIDIYKIVFNISMK